MTFNAKFSDVTELSLAMVMERVNALQDDHQLASAAQIYRDWLAHPRDEHSAAVGWFNLGVLLRQLGDLPGCVTAYQKAHTFQPSLYQASINWGLALEATGQIAQALAVWQQAMPTIEAQTLLLNHTGRLLEKQKKYPEAENALLRSLLLNPQQPDVTQHYMGLRRRQCKWPSMPVQPVAQQPDPLDVGCFYALAEFEDPQLQLQAAHRFVQRKLPKTKPIHLSSGKRYGHDKLRIGYLSGDFKAHAVSILTAEIFELHNRDRVQVFGLDYSLDDGSPLRERVVKAFDTHVQLQNLTDAAAAALIARHEIDVLIDLTGLTEGSRFGILMHKPAPVQVSYLGYMGSSSIPEVDYILVDHFVFPADLQNHFTEKPLYLPRTYQVNDRSREIGPTPERQSFGLPEGAVVLCSFNNNYKITPAVFDVWLRILQRSPHAVLWLLEDNVWAKASLQAHAQAQGIAADRLIFASRISPAQYLARYRCADLFLDTSPYNAGTTASDALWAGLPVLTCPGRSMVSRMAGSLVRAAGLPELSVDSWSAYEDMAVHLVNQPLALKALKSRLIQQKDTCSLFDSPAFVKDLEDSLIGVLT